jgi:MarR family transcriptional regulator for hemolysin
MYCSPMNEFCRGDGGVTTQLLRTAEKIERALERELGDIGLSSAKLILLTGLVQAGGQLSLGELAAHRSCVKSNITKLVDRLEEDGLVFRRDDPSDRRGVLAEITDRGRQSQAQGDRLAGDVEARMTVGISVADLGVLRRLLTQLATASEA